MKMFKKIAAAGLSALLAGSLLAGCGSTADTAKIDGTKTVLTVNEEEISLGTLSFYAKYQQAMMYAMYSSYFGTSEIFDMVMDESSGATYGENLKKNALDDIEAMVLLRQHAEEYGVSLTAEEEAQIDEIAQAYIDENTDEVREEVGASKEDVIELLELQLLKSKMLDPIAADVDVEIPEEEIQQSGVTYIQVIKKTEEDFTSDESDESSLADSSVAADTDVAAEVEAANAELYSQAEAVIAAVQATGDVANADMMTISNEINEEFYSQTGNFTTHNTEDTVLDTNVVEAVAGLSDGTLVDHVIEATDGLSWFVVRFDSTYDEAATQELRDERVKSLKQDNYDTLLAGWKDEAEITVDEAALATLIISDSNPVTLGQDPLEDESYSADESTLADESGLAAAEESAAADEAAAEESQVAEEAAADEAAAEESVAAEEAAAAESPAA